ncbi:hypothetical protein Q1W73_01945 [Asticcacaulis sp. ZE23SCel15]|uniref:hypothetical protein n=1 Tax=Asticcacaulis sp. ZE23SCel15 TaxID=3059027 RepID=UPI00265EDEA6|nr:hypothetical protein [Asticcacaulis sp. ZE23SCel15]WKL57768.1 hypothetical protein Q1W73_01945 [Asticcacaulis sp. ZE23SCel15]
MWPFKEAPFLDHDTARWHVDNMCWLIRNLANTPSFTETKMILPTPGFFVTGDKTGHALAEAIFAQVKKYAGMEDWPVQLVSDVQIYEPNADLVQATSRQTPLGMFMHDHQGPVQISYAPQLLKTPANLIATFAHELAHYLLHSVADTLPCAPEEIEFLTDQTACFLGFGVFMANSAFVFEQWRDAGTGTQGWQGRKSGYLPERDLVFDAALYIAAKGIDPEPAMKCLKPHLAQQLKKALKDAGNYSDDLRAAIDGAYTY